MKTGTFMDIVGIHYDDIKRTYCLRDNANNRKFSEDHFNDAFIKCAKHFGNNVIDYNDVIKYYWTVYVNSRKGDKYESLIELQETYSEDIENEEEEYYSQYVYKTIMAAITEAFGEDDMLIYSLYKYHNWSKDDLINAGYDCKNFEVRIKTIHKFVKEYSKKKLKKRP